MDPVIISGNVGHNQPTTSCHDSQSKDGYLFQKAVILKNYSTSFEDPEKTAEDEIDSRKRIRRDLNLYTAKKTAAEGLMDVALLTANANQLRFINEYGNIKSATFYATIVLISLSLILQVAVGVTLILKGSYYYRGQSKCKRVAQLNNFTLVGVFLITIINIFVASFTKVELVNADKSSN